MENEVVIRNLRKQYRNGTLLLEHWQLYCYDKCKKDKNLANQQFLSSIAPTLAINVKLVQRLVPIFAMHLPVMHFVNLKNLKSWKQLSALRLLERY